MRREFPEASRPLLAAAVALLLLAGCPAAESRADGPDAGPEEDPAYLAEVVLVVKVTGDGRDARVEVPLPQNDAHQTILREDLRLRGFELEETLRDGIRTAVLTYPGLKGRKRFTYKAVVRLEAGRYDFTPPELGVEPEGELRRWTIPTPRLQARSPAVRERLIRHVEPLLEDGERDIVRLIYGLVSRQFERRTGKGGTSNVLKAVRTGSADDLGLDRLFVTFLRAAGVPARNVGGLRLRDGGRKMARWTEVWLDGRWVPFSVPRGWYGAIPDRYLKLYHGDRWFLPRRNVERVSFKVLVREPREPLPKTPAGTGDAAAPAAAEGATR